MNQEIKDDEAPFKMKDGVTAYLHIVAKASLAFATSSNYLYWISTMSTKKRSEAKLGFLFLKWNMEFSKAASALASAC